MIITVSKPCREIRTHEPILLRRYAVAASASLIGSPTPDWLSGSTLPSRFTKATSRVPSDDGSVEPWVIGRGRTHEVERTDLPAGFRFLGRVALANGSPPP